MMLNPGTAAVLRRLWLSVNVPQAAGMRIRSILDPRERGIVASISLAISVFSASGFAQEPTFSPADFGLPNRLAAMQISSRDLRRGTSALAVRCQGFVERDGTLGTYYCDSDDPYADRKVVSAVIDTLPEQAFVPARVGDRTVRVLMSLSVLVACDSGSCSTHPVRNHGFHTRRFGPDYVSPQPILEGDEWYQGFDYKMTWIADWMPRITNRDRWDRMKRIPYVVAADVTEDGAVAASCLYSVSIDTYNRAREFSGPVPTVRVIDNAVESMDTVRYIPGSLDGKPMALRLFEYSVTSGSTGGPVAAFSRPC